MDGPETPNTTLHYLYRDASNYKKYGAVTFGGRITPEEEERFRAHLGQEEWFIAEQVNLKNLREEWDSHFEDDHIWHEFDSFEATRRPPDQEDDIHSFVNRFCATEWDEEAANQNLETWKARTRPGR